MYTFFSVPCSIEDLIAETRPNISGMEFFGIFTSRVCLDTRATMQSYTTAVARVLDNRRWLDELAISQLFVSGWDSLFNTKWDHKYVQKNSGSPSFPATRKKKRTYVDFKKSSTDDFIYLRRSMDVSGLLMQWFFWTRPQRAMYL